jgi:toxin-antitoxin system PIN domain toxin
MLGVPSVVMSGFLRVVTHPRVFKQPTPIATAVAFVEKLRNSDTVRILDPQDRHLAIFLELCRKTEAIGNRVPDAYLAAIAIEHGATLATADRGFARYPGLRWEHPLAATGGAASDREDVREPSDQPDRDPDRQD